MRTALMAAQSDVGFVRRRQIREVMLWTGTIVYFQLLVICYVHIVVGSGAFEYAGVIALAPSNVASLAGLVFALVPLYFVPRELDRPSSALVLYLYFTVFVPSCAIVPYASYRSLSEWAPFLATLTAAMCASIIMRPSARLSSIGFEIRDHKTFNLFMIILCFTASGIIFYFGEIDFGNLGLLDVYEKRQALFETLSFRTSLLFYLSNMAAFAIVPVSFIYGIRTRNVLLILSAILTMFLAFSFTSFKSHLFVPVLAVIVYFIATYKTKLGFAFGFLVLMTSIAVISIVLEYSSGQPILTWTLQFRLTGNNGFLTAKYSDFFAINPFGNYADSIGRFFVSPVYDRPVAQVIGESFSTVAGNHANANLWADGFSNLGYAGIAFATLELIGLMWIFDGLALGDREIMVGPIIIPAGFSLANTAVHSTLTSNGVLLVVLLIALMPRTLPQRSGF